METEILKEILAAIKSNTQDELWTIDDIASYYKMNKKALDQLKQHKEKTARLFWYESMDRWLESPQNKQEYWRPHQSACAELASLGFTLDLV